MRFQLKSLLFVSVSALAGGCLGTVGYSGSVYVPPPTATVSVNAGYSTGYVAPEMVEVEPGVQVVYDYDEPVFYSDNYYWRFYNNGWYRSSVHNGGWVSYNDAPMRVRSISRPTEYTHYRPANYTPRTRVEPQGGVQTRDHREPMREPVRNEPTVRDHRQEPMREPVRNEPTVRDHRTEQPRQEPVREAPNVRDHRTEPSPPPRNEPTVRDHRTEQPAPPAPTVRDHRTAPAPPPPAPAPKVRDHRK
jgi:hypothetical protein